MPLPTSFQRLRVQIGSHTIEVAARTRVRGETMLLLLHGLGCAKEAFNSAFDAEELDRFAICAFDFPGHGESEWLPPGMYSIEAYADVVTSLIRQLSPQRVVLVGHSMGGAVGIIAAQDAPDRASLVSIEGNLVSEDCALISRRAAELPQKVFIEQVLPDFQAMLVSSPRSDLRSWAVWLAAADPVAVHQVARSLVMWSDSGKLLDQFSMLASPTYVFGQESGDLSYVLSRLGDVPVYRVPGSGHFPMLDNPASLWRIVADAAQRRAVMPTASGRRK